MAQQIPVDRGYLNLLAHLRESKPRIPLETLQAAICHYLIHLPPTQPTPTPLTASVIASPIWHPLFLKSCLALGNTFRISVRENLAELKKKERGLFDASISSDLSSWMREILAGLKDGEALLRMTVAGGVHLGLNDLHDVKLSQRLFRDVEEALVLAFAEVTEEASARDQWTVEFKQSNTGSSEKIQLSVLLASQYFNSISMKALSALNLTSLASSCLSVIGSGFMSGTFLRTGRECLLRNADGSVALSSESSLERSVDDLLVSESFTCMAFLCRLLARVVSILADTSYRAHKRRELWSLLDDIAQKVHDMAHQVEEDWCSSVLGDVQSDMQLDERTRKLTEKTWTLLKTYLFSSLMLQQAILDTVLFVPPPPSTSGTSATFSTAHLTSMILKTLFALSFVIASFGGVTAGTAEGGKGPTFPELKKVFYMSIDILSTDAPASEAFVRGLIRDADACCGTESVASSKRPFIDAKRSFVLSCIEQFISVLDDTCIEEVVVPFCEPHLGDPSNRQTYESAHSVMLSIFSAHAERGVAVAPPPPVQQSMEDRKWKGVEKVTPSDVSLARRLVPGYAQILLENAREGGLTTAQLRLAYAALVRSASTGRNPRCFPQMNANLSGTTSSNKFSIWSWMRSALSVDEEFTGDPALAWLCVEQLLRALTNAESDTRFALSLTLISLIPNVGMQLLPRVLEEVERIIDAEADSERKRVLFENVFEEILERVGDAEREVAMRWWFETSRKWEMGYEGRTRDQVSS